MPEPPSPSQRSRAEACASPPRLRDPGLKVRVLAQLRPVLRHALVLNPEVRRAAGAGANRVVMRVVLSALADDVSFDRIVMRQRTKDANTVTTIPLNVIELNDICGNGQAARGYSWLKPDSVLSVLKHFIFLDEIVGGPVL